MSFLVHSILDFGPYPLFCIHIPFPPWKHGRRSLNLPKTGIRRSLHASLHSVVFMIIDPPSQLLSRMYFSSEKVLNHVLVQQVIKIFKVTYNLYEITHLYEITFFTRATRYVFRGRQKFMIASEITTSFEITFSWIASILQFTITKIDTNWVVFAQFTAISWARNIIYGLVITIVIILIVIQFTSKIWNNDIRNRDDYCKISIITLYHERVRNA